MVALGTITAAGDLSAQGGFEFPGDRNGGIPVSMFGTYIRSGELIIYPFYEYYTNHDAEYSPNELGFGLDQDFRAPSRGHEFLIFIGYGVSERLALEFEAALYTTAWQKKAPEDPTAMPPRIKESGLGDVEGQVRWRWARESGTRPGIFSFFEYVLPLQKDEVVIGTGDWEFKLGTGLVRGFSFGTMTLRVAAEYDGEENAVAAGEMALEYLRRLSPSVRVFGAVEGSEDEWEFIPVLMWSPHPHVALHLNSAFGITSKTEDWAPEIGVMISLP
jgi:hypothetical protein